MLCMSISERMRLVITAAKVTRDDALWAEEVARVLEAAPRLAPAARAMLRDVLASLVSDATLSPAGRRDARSMLEAVRGARLVEAAA